MTIKTKTGINPTYNRGCGPVIVRGGGTLIRLYQWLFRRPKKYSSTWIVGAGVNVHNGVNKEGFKEAMKEAEYAVKEVAIQSVIEELEKTTLVGHLTIKKRKYPVYSIPQFIEKGGIIAGVEELNDIITSRAFTDICNDKGR